MIKVQNNVAKREPLPAFLNGLAQESLLDLSWTDPALGVSDSAWWPEENNLPTLGRFEVYGDETLTVDLERKVVVITCTAEPMPQEQIIAMTQEQAAIVRAERNGLLTSTDWTQVDDTSANKTAWATYRQVLRDVPQQEGFPWSVTWPTQPE